jgi:hypothetical protein
VEREGSGEGGEWRGRGVEREGSGEGGEWRGRREGGGEGGELERMSSGEHHMCEGLVGICIDYQYVEQMGCIGRRFNDRISRKLKLL